MQKYGQHFLANAGVADKIISAVKDNLFAALVEIGPGKGFLTARLRGLAPRFAAVEIDPEMVSYLKQNFKNIEIINKDFLSFDLSSLPREKTTFVSNLPYIDAAEILLKTLEYEYFESAVFMFQREQAARILAKPKTTPYGPLSVLAQTLADVKSLFRVSAGSFNPPPKVESEVLLFKKKADADKDYFKLKELVKKAFAYKRKNIFNSLLLGGVDGEILFARLKELKIPVSARAEELDKTDYQNLIDIL